MVSFVFLTGSFFLCNPCGSFLLLSSGRWHLDESVTWGSLSENLNQSLMSKNQKVCFLLSLYFCKHLQNCSIPYCSQDWRGPWLFPHPSKRCLGGCPKAKPLDLFSIQILVQLDSWEREQPVGGGAVGGTWQGWKLLGAELMIKPSKIWSWDEKELQLFTFFPPSLGSALQLW